MWAAPHLRLAVVALALLAAPLPAGCGGDDEPAPGTGDRNRLFAVWLEGETVRVGTVEVKEMNPARVPCDVRPAFSEPSC